MLGKIALPIPNIACRWQQRLSMRDVRAVSLQGASPRSHGPLWAGDAAAYLNASDGSLRRVQFDPADWSAPPTSSEISCRSFGP